MNSSLASPTVDASTRSLAPRLTDARKEALVALAMGYLLPFPRYDPRPRTYAEIAETLRVPRTTVVKRIEAVRNQLKGAGVPGLDEEDARRPLAEWLLSMRLIVADDVAWLHRRVDQRSEAANEEREPKTGDR